MCILHKAANSCSFIIIFTIIFYLQTGGAFAKNDFQIYHAKSISRTTKNVLDINFVCSYYMYIHE